jgi:hypothetical protein
LVGEAVVSGRTQGQSFFIVLTAVPMQ